MQEFHGDRIHGAGRPSPVRHSGSLPDPDFKYLSNVKAFFFAPEGYSHLHFPWLELCGVEDVNLVVFM